MGVSALEPPRPSAARCLLAALGCLVVLWVAPAPARAVIVPPTTIDGPSTDGLSLEGAAMAPDGTGGIVYTKTAGGVPHVFVSRYDGDAWSAPIRVDAEIPYEAGQARIAAGNGGRLLVVWVTQVATLTSGELRMGLYSATLGPGASGFGLPLLVDPNVGNGAGVSPSLAGVTPGRAIVAYRVVTKTFGLPGEFTNAVQLRPGDVLADIRVARLEGDRWSRLGPVNRYPAASMRPPSPTNGPEVAIDDSGRAVVAWQEPDLSGAARVWMRRIDGTTVGPVLAASPEKWNGKPVGDEATAIGLAVTGYDRARVAVRVDGSASSPLHGQRIFLTSLGPYSSPEGATPAGPELADGEASPPAPLGPPAVAAADAGGSGGSLRLAFSVGKTLRLVRVSEQGKLLPPEAPLGPAAQPETPVVATVDPEGGGVDSYEAVDEAGSPTVAVRQEFPAGGSQTGLLYGPVGGPTSQLVGGGSGAGDALLAFRQGESGRFAIVADRVSAPPAKFPVTVPRRWVRPRRARVSWPVAPSAVGGLSYALIVDGRTVRSDLTRRHLTPPPSVLASGVHRVQVMASDQLGGDVLSRPAKLRVDAQPPQLRVLRKRGEVVVRLTDAQSGLVAKATRVRFGDGTQARGGGVIRHRYARPGTYTIVVRARDEVDNRLAQRLRVVVR